MGNISPRRPFGFDAISRRVVWDRSRRRYPLWHWATGGWPPGAVSESGRFCHGEGTRGRGARRRRVLELPTLSSTESGTTPLQVAYARCLPDDRRMSWVYLVIAGLFEIGWPIGLKLAQSSEKRVVGITLAVACLVVSGWLLWLAQRDIPMGTAYAVWTGIGAAGTFLVGIWVFGDPSSLARYLGVVLIIVGVATLRLAH